MGSIQSVFSSHSLIDPGYSWEEKKACSNPPKDKLHKEPQLWPKTGRIELGTERY